MGARRSHPDVKIHLSDFMWTKCIYVHLTRFYFFLFVFLLGGGDGGRVDLCSSETNKQLNPDLSDSRFLRRGPVGGLLADIARSLFTTWQQEAQGPCQLLSTFRFF